MRRTPPEPRPIDTHEHEFRPIKESPIIEDGAAIFRLECNWVEITGSSTSKRLDETFYETGAECEATDYYRFEYSTLESPDGEEYDVKPISEWEENIDLVKQEVVRIEEEKHDEPESWDVDPDPDCGQVTLTHEGWELHFEP